MRVAVYARYSTDQQRPESIPDQFRVCRARAEREGWTVVREYSDAAISGSSLLNRPGIQALLRDVAQFDIVLTEDLERLSRDPENLSGLFKRIRFAGRRIVTLRDNEVSLMHVGLKGTMSAMFLQDLADRTRRGLGGLIAEGKSAGGRCYGYRVGGVDGLATGAFEIDAIQAAVVARVFTEFAAGASPKSIAKRLNAEGVPGPRGDEWGPSTIHGHVKRGSGILNNELYVGRRVWNRQRYGKHPDTGKRVSRINPRTEWMESAVPELRIIDDALWEAAKTRQRATRHVLRDGIPLVRARRAKYLFSGLIRCGVCGSSFAMFSKDRLACAGAHNRGTCENRASVRRDEVERRVLRAMEERLWNKQLFDEFYKEFTRELNQLRTGQSAALTDARKELASIEAKASKCVKWFTDIWDGENREAADRMERELQGLEERRKELEASLAAADRSHRGRPLLHPEMGETYRTWVVEARGALNDPARNGEAMNALRGMVQEITITPKAGELEIVLKGDLAEMLVAAGRSGEADDLRRQVKVVAGAGFEPATFGL